MNTTNNKISAKETAFGHDMLEVLIDKQLRQVRFKELDVPQAIKTMEILAFLLGIAQLGELSVKYGGLEDD